MNKYNILEGNITYSVKEDANGDKYWYLNNHLHRVNNPAIELASGTKYWYLNGKFHRENGPAVEWSNGSKFWYYHGTYISCHNLKEFNRQIKLLSIS